jgi:hypothetical protein
MDHDLVRIFFELDSKKWHGNASERLWAERVSGGRFRLRNSPFFAFGVSNEDVVFGEMRDGCLYFTSVSVRGGHSTYRLKLAKPGIQEMSFKASWAPLENVGCSFEEGPVIAVDVPASADIYNVYKLLDIGEQNGVWEFEEGHCGHTVGHKDAI